MSPAAPHARELAARDSDGIHVVLLWHPDENALTVSVDDNRAGDRFEVAVPSDRALDVFYHPVAYTARARSTRRHRTTADVRPPTLDQAAPTGAGH
jgi:hypothetical protein